MNDTFEILPFGATIERETPATLKASVARLPAPLRPRYQALGALPRALGADAAAGPGLYAIEFTVQGRTRVYSGQSHNLRRRLQQHLLCARMFGIPVASHQVYVAPMPRASANLRRDVEQRIHADMFANSPGVLTNQRRELEAELFGEI